MAECSKAKEHFRARNLHCGETETRTVLPDSSMAKLMPPDALYLRHLPPHLDNQRKVPRPGARAENLTFNKSTFKQKNPSQSPAAEAVLQKGRSSLTFW